MTFEAAKDLLERNGQAHVLQFWSTLDTAGQAALLAQIATLDFKAIGRMQAMLKDASAPKADAVREVGEPAPVEILSDDQRAQAVAAGEDLLRAGRAGVLMVAGGQGSRLGYDGPKGMYPIAPVTERCIFFFHAHQIIALSRKYNVRIPFYIMTSETNDEATRAHFARWNYLGLNPEDVFFFKQGMWPALTADGKIMLDEPGHIFMNPDGHGGMLSALAASGAVADMEKRNVTSLFFFQVDNPLVEICDPAFMGLHAQRKAGISVKVCAKRNAKEGLGIVVKRGGKFAMVEYSELTPEQMEQRTPDGELYYKYGSVAIHVFDREFLKREALGNMPLHIAHKKIPYCDAAGKLIKPDTPNGYKFEKFIFDVLPDADTVVNLAFDRAEEFSPLKNAEGDDSPATVRRDLMAKWSRRLQAAGVAVPNGDFEVDPADPLKVITTP